MMEETLLCAPIHSAFEQHGAPRAVPIIGTKLSGFAVRSAYFGANYRPRSARDGTRKLSEISDRKFSGNFRKEILIPFRNHSIFVLILHQYILIVCLIRPGFAGNAGYFMPLEIWAKRSGQEQSAKVHSFRLRSQIHAFFNLRSRVLGLQIFGNFRNVSDRFNVSGKIRIPRCDQFG